MTRTYDAAGRLTNVSTTDSVVSYAYDDANRQIAEDQSLTGQPLRHITTPVDADGNRASLSLAGVYTLYYDYTQRQQLAHIRDSATPGSGQWFEYTYNLNGNVTKRQNVFQGLDSTNFSYDALNRVTQVEQTGLNDVNFATSHYEYDLVNNIQDTYRDEQAGKGERFGYDDANQLISAVYNADGVQTPNPTNATRTVGYTLTPLNRLSLTDNGALTNYTADGMNQYTQVTGLASLYDSNFNQRKLGGWVYTYDAARRLTKAANASTGSSIDFGYDGLNRVTKRVTNGVAKVFTYDGWKQIAEWNGNGSGLLAWNLYGPGPDEILLRRISTTNYLHYHADQFGSVKFLLDQNNTGIEKYTYDAFGAPTITSWTGQPRTESAYGNRFMFTGREYLTPTGLYDYRNRIYSPVIGRFLQVDPIGFDAGDDNLYRYVGHNPTNVTNPTGTTVFIEQTPVAGIGNHTWLRVVPSNPAAFAGDPNFAGGYVTISGQPSNGNPFFGSYLNTRFNANTPDQATSTAIAPPPAGVSSAQFDSNVYNTAVSYSNDTYHYFFVPELYNFISDLLGGIFGHAWNSNGYVAANLDANGKDGTGIVQRLPGWQPGGANPPPQIAGYESNGTPIFQGRAVSGFRPDGSPIYAVPSVNTWNLDIAPAGVMSVPWPTAQMPSGIQL